IHLHNLVRAHVAHPLDIPHKKQRRELVRERAKVAWKGGGDHYSPTASGGHNFCSRASIDAPFAPTRSLFRPLQFYTTWKVTIDGECASGACGWDWVE
ncbi:hypothetical protein PIB30_062883, partial [Stylosanthes scabra]|nr:hypothetical protein [Stylosanthes scabra]